MTKVNPKSSPCPQPPETGAIYRITGPGGRVYIGSAENLRRRWKAHKALLRRGKHHNYRLQRDWTKYGEDAFTFAIVEEIAVAADLIPAEQRHLDAALVTEETYNLCFDVRSPARGLVHTPESRRKMSIAVQAALTPEILEGRRERFQGDLNPSSKLNAARVLAICDRLLDGAHPAKVAADLEITQEAVYQIRSGRTWKHVVSPEMVAAMMAIRQNPYVNGLLTVTEERRAHGAAVGRSNKGRKLPAERVAQMSEKARGAGNPRAKVTEVGVRQIRLLAVAKVPDEELAVRFGLSASSVGKIRRRETWQHVI